MELTDISSLDEFTLIKELFITWIFYKLLISRAATYNFLESLKNRSIKNLYKGTGKIAFWLCVTDGNMKP